MASPEKGDERLPQQAFPPFRPIANATFPCSKSVAPFEALRTSFSLKQTGPRFRTHFLSRAAAMSFRLGVSALSPASFSLALPDVARLSPAKSSQPNLASTWFSSGLTQLSRRFLERPLRIFERSLTGL